MYDTLRTFNFMNFRLGRQRRTRSFGNPLKPRKFSAPFSNPYGSASELLRYL